MSSCPRGKCRMLCEKWFSCSWGSIVKASCWCPGDVCSSFETAPNKQDHRPCGPCQWVSGQCREQVAVRHLGLTQYSLVGHRLQKPLCFSCPLGLLALCQTQLCSPLKNKSLWSLSGTGFPEAQRIPTGRFQRSLSVVTAPDGSSHGTQVLL